MGVTPGFQWRPKPPRAYKVARQRTLQQKRAPLEERLANVRKRENRLKRVYGTPKDPPPADNIFDPNYTGTDVNPSDIRVFESTSSPFVYQARDFVPDENDDDETGLPYWSRPSRFVRSRCAFCHFSEADFASGTWPETSVAEVAFLGRSNVGKSSLMNALMQAKLARTSKLPGRTQHAYYFGMFPNGLDTRDWRRASGFLVDLPGYGYAVGPDDAVDSWQSHTQRYLLARMRSGHLVRLYLLVDGRQVQQSLDWSILKWLDETATDLPYSIVFTKADSSSPQELSPLLNTLSMRYNQKFRPHTELDHRHEELHQLCASVGVEAPHNKQTLLDQRGGQSPIFHVTSATKGMGLDELWKSISWEFQHYQEYHN